MLEDKCKKEKMTSVHGFHCHDRKVASNSFQTSLRRLQEKYWQVRLLFDVPLKNFHEGNLDVVDIGFVDGPHGTDVVDWNHPCPKNTIQMRTAWLKIGKNEVLCMSFREYMRMGWNNGLSTLMKNTSKVMMVVGRWLT